MSCTAPTCTHPITGQVTTATDHYLLCDVHLDYFRDLAFPKAAGIHRFSGVVRNEFRH